MSDSIFKELETSMNQALEIAQGRQKAARVTKYEVADVKAIRSKLNVSQKDLALTMNVSIDTVKSWEKGRRNPTGLASKVLHLIENEPELYTKLTLS
ncbi:NadS family protein [Parashewanella tropica]|uniref:NadS family protein n=1 Tax=Parashewanella tropica TaxID=2547970 RepID=UPI001C54FEB8|nr:NadS family protein [Parashewanella tropica]